MNTNALCVGICLLFFCLPLTIHAQLSKGARTYSPTAGLSYSPNDGTATLLGSYTMNQGRMLTDHWMVGASVGGDAAVVGNEFRVGTQTAPYVRYYFNPQQRLTFFAGLQGSVAKQFDDMHTHTAVSIFPHVGANYFLHPDVSIRARLGTHLYLSDPQISPLTLSFDLESFFSNDAWTDRKDASPTLDQGTLMVRDARLVAGIDNRGTSFEAGGTFGYMLTDRWMIGSGVHYRSLSNQSSAATVSPFVRYYLNKDRTSWYLQGQASLNTTTTRLPDFRKVTSTSAHYFFGGGFTKFLRKRIALDLQLGIGAFKNDLTNRFETRFAGKLGIQYHFGGGK